MKMVEPVKASAPKVAQNAQNQQHQQPKPDEQKQKSPMHQQDQLSPPGN